MNAISPHIDHARHKANLRRSFRLGLREALVTVPLVQILPPTQITIPALVFLTALFTKAYDLPRARSGSSPPCRSRATSYSWRSRRFWRAGNRRKR